MGKSPSNTEVRFWRDPDLPGVEVRYSSYNEEAFRKHTHPTYSIGFIESGGTTFELEGGRYTARTGDMVLIGPGMVHACNPDRDTVMAYRMFYVTPDWLETVAQEVFGPLAGPPSFPVPVVDDPDLRERWHALHRAIADGGGRLEKETLLVRGLADLLLRHGRLGVIQEPKHDEDAVSRAKGYLADHIADKVSLAELSAIAHLSRYHLLRVFQAATGLPPHAFQTQLRVDRCKQLLSEGVPISQTALAVGFADQSHFSRVFKQYTGATPRQYQAGLRHPSE